jgi:hypothetical protein
MTGYHLSIGYNGASVWREPAAWDALKEAARVVSDDPQAIVAEARRLGSPESCDDGCCQLDSYADNYAEPFSASGHPVKIIERESEDRGPQIMQMASTGDAIKYHVRRAWVRLVIERMHRHGIEVNLHVA